MTTASAPAWEVTFLRRARGSSRARIAGRLVLEAPDLDHARRAAEQALTERPVAEEAHGDLLGPPDFSAQAGTAGQRRPASDDAVGA